MRHLGPVLISWALYVAVRYVHNQKLDPKLFIEATVFALCAHFLMYIYHHCMGYIEGMSTFGKRCPNGYKMVDDPLNPLQQTCVPTGHPTQ